MGLVSMLVTLMLLVLLAMMLVGTVFVYFFLFLFCFTKNDMATEQAMWCFYILVVKIRVELTHIMVSARTHLGRVCNANCCCVLIYCENITGIRGTFIQ